jgi:hypothetical protein
MRRHQGQRARPDGASMDVSTDVDVVMEIQVLSRKRPKASLMYDRVLQYCQVAEVWPCLYNIARWLKLAMSLQYCQVWLKCSHVYVPGG